MSTSLRTRVLAVAGTVAGVATAGVVALTSLAPALPTTAADASTAAFGLAAPASLPYGPDTCKDGFVWREAGPADHVCVTPSTRDKTAQENREAGAHRQGSGAYGPLTCVPGYVWREAYAGDAVCVLPDRRDQAALNNAKAAERRAVDPASAACSYDATSTATDVGGVPTRYRSGSSMSIGARWNRCTHQVAVHFGDFGGTADSYNIRVDGRQRELTGGSGNRVYRVADTDPFFAGEGDHRISVQACVKGSFLQGSSCTPWSPVVTLPVHVGSVTQG